MIMFFEPTPPGFMYPLSQDGARAALEFAGDRDLSVAFQGMIERRTLPRECQQFVSSVAVLMAMHNRDFGYEHPRSLTVFQVPESYGAVLHAVQASLVGRFLLDWRTRTPEDQWRTWAMFLMMDRHGDLTGVPVRIPRRPVGTIPPNSA